MHKIGSRIANLVPINCETTSKEFSSTLSCDLGFIGQDHKCFVCKTQCKEDNNCNSTVISSSGSVGEKSAEI